jgi:hypothetical protein
MGRPGFLVVALLAFASAPASAETPQDRAQQLFTEGRDLIQAGDAKAACAKFEAAIALDHSAPGVMLNLGLCYEKLGKLATSLRWYRKAQVAAREARPEPLAEYEQAATASMAGLEPRVATVTTDRSAAPQVEVLIDGVTLTADDYRAYPLDAGTHQLEARAPHKVSYTETITIADRQTKTIAIPALGEEAREVSGADQAHPGRTRRIVGVGLAIVGAGVFTGSALYAKKISDDFHIDGKPENAHTRLTVLTATGLAGVAAVGVGVYLLWTAPKQERNATALAPVVTSEQLGFAVTGGF